MLWPLVADAVWWIELIDHGGSAIIVPIVTLAAPYLALPFLAWFAARRGSRGQHQAIAAIGSKVESVEQLALGITGQVINDHTGKPVLREDVDKVIANTEGLPGALQAIRDEMRGGFAAVRGDLGEEREARRALATRVTALEDRRAAG